MTGRPTSVTKIRSTASGHSSDQQLDCLAATAEHHHEHSGTSIFSCLRITHHGAGAVVDLKFFSWSGPNHRTCLQWLPSTQLAHVALDRLIATAETVLGDQVLPDCTRISAPAQT